MPRRTGGPGSAVRYVDLTFSTLGVKILPAPLPVLIVPRVPVE
jgi:hypothetical protein